ncbi:MAG: patatin-like phospholipase family protein [Proteobacteria bacterium]|nr:patatin-like phospholipase family protein [Pseudomonadota bacterium]MBU4294930.1 patatin-like phospholipase family protein [Pseudomonadota bacterium]MCG2745924.1 patatin-like phospholipase family protein [Desulfobulbaceae bacterium]
MGNGVRCKLDDVRRRELEIIADRRDRIRKRVGRPTKSVEASKTLVGLALSGGGIRSAATNLGILQGLSKSGMLQFVDYLSTVSGGGYIGACLSSLLSNPRDNFGKVTTEPTYKFSSDVDSEALFNTSWESFPFRDDHVSLPANRQELSGQEQMEHIRTRASYLTPRPRYLSDTLMRAVGAVTFTTLTPFLWFLLVMILLTSVYMGIVAGLAPAMKKTPTPQQISAKASIGEDGSLKVACEAADKQSAGKEITNHQSADEGDEKFSDTKGAWKTIKHYSKQPFIDLVDNLPWKTWFIPLAAGVLLGVGLPCFFLRKPARKTASGESAQQALPEAGGEDPEGVANRKRFRAICLLISIFLGGVLCLAAVALRKWGMGSAQGAMLLLPGVSLAGAYLGSGLYYFAIIEVMRPMRSTILGMWPDEILIKWRNQVSQRVMNPELWTKENRSILNMIQGACFVGLVFTLLLALLPGLILASDGVYVACVQVPLMFGLKFWLAGQDKKASEKKGKKIPEKFKNWLLGLLVPLVVLLAVVWVGSILTSKIIAPTWPEMSSGWARWKLLFVVLGSGALLAVFSCWVDVNKASPHYFYRDRLAEAFLRTFGRRLPEDVGYGYVSKRDDTEMELKELHGVDADDPRKCKGRGPYLLINATLNLTAAHDLKGFNRKGEVFTFSRCYVGSERTGYVRTEDYEKGELKLARTMTISGAAATSVMGVNSSLLLSFASTIVGIRLGYWLENAFNCRWNSRWQKLYKLFPAAGQLLQELSSYTDDRGPEIYLSDGGHSGDNLGILPLLRRRARIIIASDAECDPDHAFDSFNSSVRQAYVDEGIKISISLQNIYRNEDGGSAKHYAVGRILYPDRPWQHSWIIILKNTMTKEEVAPLINYQHKHNDFPHESTGDQFFTEEQFESYRALGRHAADEACRELFPWSVETEEQKRLSVSGRDKDPWEVLMERICKGLNVEKVSHPWDDLLVAMWEGEQGGFADWGSFKIMLERHAVTLACLARHETKREFFRKEGSAKDFVRNFSVERTRCQGIPYGEREFWSLYQYVAGLKPDDLQKRDPVPRSMKEFRIL